MYIYYIKGVPESGDKIKGIMLDIKINKFWSRSEMNLLIFSLKTIYIF